MAPRRRPRSPSRRAPGGEIAAAAAAGSTPSSAAGGAAAVALASRPAREVLERILRGFLALLRRLSRRRTAQLSDRLSAAGVPPDELQRAIAREEEYELEFRKNAEARMRAAFAVAERAPDPSARAAAVEAAMRRERRYVHQRAAAQFQRTLHALEADTLRRISPEGAYWALGNAENHTPDCLAMAGQVWPWAVLNLLPLPLHTGCACRLESIGGALAAGKISAAQSLVDKADAMKRAMPVILFHQREEAERRDGALRELRLREELAEIPGVDLNVLAAAPLAEDAAPDATFWRPWLHPRDAFGRFIETVGAMPNRGKARTTFLDSRTRVTRDTDGTYRVVRNTRLVRGFTDPADAARAAFDISARSDDHDAVGTTERGPHSFGGGFDGFLKSEGIDPDAPVKPDGSPYSPEELREEVVRLDAEINRARTETAKGDRYAIRRRKLLEDRRENLGRKLIKAGGIVPERVEPHPLPPMRTTSQTERVSLRRKAAPVATEFEEYGVGDAREAVAMNGDRYEARPEGGRWRVRRVGGLQGVNLYRTDHPFARTGREPDEEGVVVDNLEEAQGIVARSNQTFLGEIREGGKLENVTEVTPVAPGDVVEMDYGWTKRRWEILAVDPDGGTVLRRAIGEQSEPSWSPWTGAYSSLEWGNGRTLPLAEALPNSVPEGVSERGRPVAEEILEAKRLAAAQSGVRVAEKDAAAHADQIARAQLVEEPERLIAIGKSVEEALLPNRGEVDASAAKKAERAAYEAYGDATHHEIRPEGMGIAEYSKQYRERVWAARKRWMEARKALTHANAARRAALLREVRPSIGKKRPRDLEGRAPRSDLRPLFDRGLELFPAEWMRGAYWPRLRKIQGRASYFSGSDEIQTREGDQGTMAHEMSHWMEHAGGPGAAVKTAERALYQRRTKGETPKLLRNLVPGSRYRRDEKSRPDDFYDAYVGKDYGDGYYEIFSMGVEAFYYAPEMGGGQGWNRDPDHMRWTIGLLVAG